MTIDDIRNDYFDWLYNLVCGRRYAKGISYRKILLFLHEAEFVWLLPMDQNRANEGIDLRWRYVCEHYDREDYEYILDVLDAPCSVLEMMVAIAIHCEDHIMDDPLVGDRTGQWFWGMMVNLGLGSMADTRFDNQQAEAIVSRFLNREYEPDGRGGLFTIQNCDRDLRHVEIFHQMCWYLNTIANI